MDLLLAFIFSIGSVICHQRPERSFFLDGHQLPVCARCTGLYLSGALGLIGWIGVNAARGWRPRAIDPRRAARLIVIAAIPTAVSLASGAIGLWDGSNVTRALLAIPLGASAGAIVAAVGTKDLR
jgi:uncharacterized membrane protein